MTRLIRMHAMRPLILSISLFCAGASASAQTMSGFGCSGVAGSVIFRDTFYGTLTGALIASVYVLARDEWQGMGKRVSSGALIGSVAGLGLGVTEIMLRDCHEPSRPGVGSVAPPWHGGLVLLGPPAQQGAGAIAAAVERRW